MSDYIKPSPYVSDGEIGIASMSVTYIQENDTNSPQDEVQLLTIETSDVACSDEYPFYYNVKIEGHWSFNTVEDFAKLINDFEKRLKTR